MNGSFCLPLCSCLTLAAPVSTKTPALSLLFNKGDSPSRHCLVRPPAPHPPLATVLGMTPRHVVSAAKVFSEEQIPTRQKLNKSASDEEPLPRSE